MINYLVLSGANVAKFRVQGVPAGFQAVGRY